MYVRVTNVATVCLFSALVCMCTYFKILKAYDSRLKMLWETPHGLPIPYNMWARAILTKVRDKGHMTSPPPLLSVTMWTATILVKQKRDFTAIFTKGDHMH